MHNTCTSITDNSQARNKLWTYMHKNHVAHIKHLGFMSQYLFKCLIKPENYARTSVPVPSTCTKRENQVLFKEK